jgi:glycosyltransferase involved in cell wall biosynthesis
MIPRNVVDVVIPCFNGANFIERCIGSVLSQTSPVNKIIFVDDGSTDASLAIILKLQVKHSRIKIITQDNRGLAAARNKGISFSEAALISFLDVDDYWLPNKIENQLKLFHTSTKSKTVAVASNYFDEIDSKRKPGISNSGVRVISPQSLLTYRTVIPGSGSSVLIPKTLFDNVGLFDEQLKYGEDLDLWIRIARNSQWVISNERDVVIYGNPNGIQARKKESTSMFEQDSFKILERYREELTVVQYFLMRSYIRSIAIRGKKRLELLKMKNIMALIVGTYYAMTIKIDRKIS